MTSRLQYYRNRADECERAARDTHDPLIKVLLLGLMNQWRILVRQVENLDLDALPPSGE